MDTDTPNMMKLARAHDSHLPVWSKGNVYFNGAKAWKHEEGGLVDNEHQVYVNLETKDGRPVLSTNVYDFLEGFTGQMVNTQVLGMAFEPEEYYENPDGTPSTSTPTTSATTAARPLSPAPLPASAARRRSSSKIKKQRPTGAAAAAAAPFCAPTGRRGKPCYNAGNGIF